jgi:hypothetical protein
LRWRRRLQLLAIGIVVAVGLAFVVTQLRWRRRPPPDPCQLLVPATVAELLGDAPAGRLDDERAAAGITRCDWIGEPTTRRLSLELRGGDHYRLAREVAGDLAQPVEGVGERAFSYRLVNSTVLVVQQDDVYLQLMATQLETQPDDLARLARQALEGL